MSLPLLETPTYELVLPSTNKKIKSRPFLVKEHKILMTLQDAETTEIIRVIKDLISVCTFEKLNVDKLPNFDMEYIFLNLRAKSIGENVNVVVSCPCGNEIKQSINLEEVHIENKKIDNKIFLRDKVGAVFRYPNFEEMMEIYENINNSKIFICIANCVDSIFTDKEFYSRENFTNEEADNFLSQLTKEEFKKVEEFFVNMPKVVQNIEADCDKCGRHNETKLEGIENFFV